MGSIQAANRQLHNEKLLHNKSFNRKGWLGHAVKIILLAVIILLFVVLSNTTAEAASGIKIYNYTTKKTTTYADQQVKVTYNGTALGSSKTPGILVNNVALVSYYDVFENSKIAADCVYDKKNGTISISKYGKTVAMKIGSKSATVNGKAVTLAAAPVVIKYVNANTSKLLVPSRFVAENLGLGYQWYKEKSTVAIQKTSLTLSYNGGEQFEYTGTLCNVTIDGKAINLGNMKSIIVNNTAMLRAKKVFGDSSINAGYSYNSSKKTVTLTKDNNVLVMTIGSTTATLNNKQVKLDVGPMIVTNHETGTSYVMVPGTFTAASLGYDYAWNNSTRTSIITTRSKDTSGDSDTAPELGDSGVVHDPGTILNQWTADTALYGESGSLHELIGTGQTQGVIHYASRDYANTKKNAETYMVAASAPFGKVTASHTDNKLTITADYMSCTNQTYQLLGTQSSYVNTLDLYAGTESYATDIVLDMVTKNYSYDISLSPDNTVLYITVYMNTITSAAIGINQSGDYLMLTETLPTEENITVQSGFMYIDLPNTVNGIGDVIADIAGTAYIRQVISVNMTDRTQIILALNEGYEYFAMEDGNQFILSFRAPGSSGQDGNQGGSPDDSTGNSDSSNSGTGPVKAEIPVVDDKSKYEIVIPKPAEVAVSKITDEDFYASKYFVIRIPGDYTQFYKDNKITYNSAVINSVSVTLSNNQTVIKIATSKVQGYALARDENNIYVNIGDPKEIYKNIVVLDPGHGGPAPGAQYFGVKEKDVNFSILYTVGKKYFDSDTSKLKVYYTRTSDVDIGLSARGALVQTYGADLFVSLHMNAADVSVTGTEVYYSKKNNAANKAGLTSSKLASIFVANLTDKLNMNSRGVKYEDYTVIYKNTVPAVLIELGFLSTKSENQKLTDPVFQENAAKTIYETLLSVFAQYPTGR